MIIVLKPDVTADQRRHLDERIAELGFKPHPIEGEQRTVIGLIGDDNHPEVDTLNAVPGVEQVMRVLKPFKFASREFHPEPSAVRVGSVAVGGGSLAMIAGPCAVESEGQMAAIAKRVRAAGANLLRGGAFKPRTSPYSFQGLGQAGLQILRDTGREFGMPTVTEVMDPRQVELIGRYADAYQIGARNMQNFDLLKEVGQTRKPVLLKRGMAATVKDLLMSAEYVLASGNPNVILCERGVRSFDSSTRNLLDLAAVPNVKSQSHLPIIVDPSHATGMPHLIPAMAKAALAAGADGVHIEVHHDPEHALSDGPQALLPDQYDEVMADLRRLAGVFGSTIA